MDWDCDLWDPPTDFNYEENDSCDLSGQNPQFCFDPRDDIIEQEALNAIYFAEVLKIQVDPATSEIDKLEPELASLKSEMRPNLKENIEFLRNSITLKKKQKNDEEVELLLGAPPAESSNEIVKGLVGNFKDHQETFPSGSVDGLPTHSDSKGATNAVSEVKLQFCSKRKRKLEQQ